jgi:hypothetical protein
MEIRKRYFVLYNPLTISTQSQFQTIQMLACASNAKPSWFAPGADFLIILI